MMNRIWRHIVKDVSGDAVDDAWAARAAEAAVSARHAAKVAVAAAEVAVAAAKAAWDAQDAVRAVLDARGHRRGLLGRILGRYARVG